MKKLALAAVALFVAGCAWFALPFAAKGAFSVSGTIDVAPRLTQHVSRPNMVCFVVAKNMGDVPVAIKRFVNPKFPLKFEIKSSDLMLADSWKEPLKVEVQINDHGAVGELHPGDVFGKSSGTARFYAKDFSVTANKMLGVPTLVSAKDKETADKEYIFKSAAR